MQYLLFEKIAPRGSAHGERLSQMGLSERSVKRAYLSDHVRKIS